MKQRWAGLGGGGLKVSYELLREAYNAGVLEPVESTNHRADLPETPRQQMEERSQSSKDEYPTYLEVNSSTVELSYYGIDTDTEIIQTISEVDQQAWDRFGEPNKEYFALIDEFGGSGTGAVPERIEDIVERTPAVTQFINDIHNGATDLFIPVFSLDGGSGFGFFEQHLRLIDQGNNIIFDSNNTSGRTVPIAIFPHRGDGSRRCVWHERGIERTAADNAIRGTEYIEERLEKLDQSGLIDTCVLVDNDFAAYNALCNGSKKHDFDTVTKTRVDILDESDFKRFYENIPSLNYTLANKGIKQAMLPIVSTIFRTDINFGKPKLDGYDHTDLNSFFKGNFLIPAYFELSYRKQANEIFNQYNIESWARKLGYLSYYTLCLSCAPFNADKINNIKVFIWEQGSNSITEDIRSEVEKLVSGLGVSQVTVDPVIGIQDDSEVKIWTLTGVESIKNTLQEKMMYDV